jgi:hypothetical protein
MSVSNLLDRAKEIAELARNHNDLVLYQKAVDLRDEVFKLGEENLSLRERIRELEDARQIDEQLVREGNCYYRPVAGSTRHGPFCMVCWDGDRKLINVTSFKSNHGTIIRCERCESK